MNRELRRHVSTCEAIASLLHPHAEVVLHDLASGTIAHMAGCFSKRRAGEPSMTDLEIASSLDSAVIGPYRKTGWDRRQLRCVTAVLRDATDRPIGLLCINLDISAFEGAVDFIRTLIEFTPSNPPAALFKSDWKDLVNTTVDEYLRDRRLSASDLGKPDLMDLIARLNERGVFSIRNAAPYVADVLQVSRATLYKHLRSIKDDVGKRSRGDRASDVIKSDLDHID